MRTAVKCAVEPLSVKHICLPSDWAVQFEQGFVVVSATGFTD